MEQYTDPKLVYREHRTQGIGTKIPTMLTLVPHGRVQRNLNWDMYLPAVEAFGPLGFDESFVYEPLLSMGGPQKVENLKKRNTITAIQTMTHVQGVIEH